MSGRKRSHLDDKQFYEIPQAPLGARCFARNHVPVIQSPVFVVRNQSSQERVEALRCDFLIVGKTYPAGRAKYNMSLFCIC